MVFPGYRADEIYYNNEYLFKITFCDFDFCCNQKTGRLYIYTCINSNWLFIIRDYFLLYNFQKVARHIHIPFLSYYLDNLKKWVEYVLPNLYTNFSTMFLRIQGGEVATGLFDAGKRFISIGEQIIDVLSRTFFPFLARRLDKHSLYAKINLFICGFISISMFFGADLLIKIFFTKDFNDSARVIRILAISPFFLSLMNTYGTNYLVLVGKERVLRNIVLVCSIFGFLLSFLAITLYGFVGAAWTLTTVWGIRGGITYLYARKHKQEIEKQEMKAVRPRHIGGVL
jgi:PST family polysaccharide transporter